MENQKLYILPVYNYTLKVDNMFTANERKVLRFLMTSNNYYSINNIAKECNITPNGTYKILKKLEGINIIYFKDIGKIKAYKINFNNTLTFSYLEIALSDERVNEAKVKVRITDLIEIKEICKAAVLFGSYITKKKYPEDIDILFVFDKDKFNIYKEKLKKIREIMPYKLHDVIQTSKDLTNNLKEQDKVIIDIIRNGVVLWGHEIIARSVKNAQT